MGFNVNTRDVDGATTRTYRTLAGARKRFESMAGHTLEAAIAEQFYDTNPPPSVEQVLASPRASVRSVSNYGCVVTLRGFLPPTTKK